jgi:hypothetical protein
VTHLLLTTVSLKLTRSNSSEHKNAQRHGILLFIGYLLFLHGSETWCPIRREEYRLRNMRRIFGLKREEEMGEWSKVQNEELHHLYCSINVIKLRRRSWEEHIVRMEEM